MYVFGNFRGINKTIPHDLEWNIHKYNFFGDEMKHELSERVESTSMIHGSIHLVTFETTYESIFRLQTIILETCAIKDIRTKLILTQNLEKSRLLITSVSVVPSFWIVMKSWENVISRDLGLRCVSYGFPMLHKAPDGLDTGVTYTLIGPYTIYVFFYSKHDGLSIWRNVGGIVKRWVSQQ